MGSDATSRCAEMIVDLPEFVVLAAGEYGSEPELLVETTIRPSTVLNAAVVRRCTGGRSTCCVMCRWPVGRLLLV